MVRAWRGTLHQPFAVALFKGIWHAHPRFLNRTVLVKENDVDSAFHLLNREPLKPVLGRIQAENPDYDFEMQSAYRFLTESAKSVQLGEEQRAQYANYIWKLMDTEGMLKIVRQTQYYQKPYMQRKALSLEASTAIFNEDMRRKAQFLMRKNRIDTYPGQMTT